MVKKLGESLLGGPLIKYNSNISGLAIVPVINFLPLSSRSTLLCPAL